MAPKPRVLLDLNIVLDVIQQREPHNKLSAAILDAVAQEEISGLLAAHTITTLFYLLSRQQSHQVVTTVLNQVLNNFSIATVNEEVIRDALSLNWRDFEDAVQMSAAVHASADYLVTRNPKDFEVAVIPVVQPGTLLSLLSP